MGRSKELVADGITPVQKTSFQSFTTQVKNKCGVLYFSVPKPIQKHLDLTKDTILEVAIREISFKYARENYNVDFFPHTIICPECGEKGRLSHWFRNYVVVTHSTKGRRGIQKICYLSQQDIDKLIKNYECKHGI